MKLNSKGMTIVEILISVVLISLVLGFLFKLLIDIQEEQDSNNFAYQNQINRAEFIHTVEADLNSHVLLGIEDVSSSSDGNIAINFYYQSGGDKVTSTLKTTQKSSGNNLKYYISYVDFNGNKYSYEMKGARLDVCGNFISYRKNDSDNYYFRINIPIYNQVYNQYNTEKLNNNVDDIEIVYYGPKNNLVDNTSYLTNYELKNIGKICN